MENIKNYKLKTFLKQSPELIEEYSSILKHLEEIPTKNELKSLKLREVEFVKKQIGNDKALAEIFEYMHEIDEEKLMNLKITEFYGFFNYIINQLEALLATEERHLVSEHVDFKWEAVEGSKRLSKLGILPMIDNLAQGDILKYEQILDLPYMTVFKKLMLDRIKGDIEKDMNKVKTRSNDV